MIKKEELSFLSQLISSFEEASVKLEEAYEERNHENFNKIKKFMMEIQKRISDIIR